MTAIVDSFALATSAGDFNRARLNLQRFGTPIEVRTLHERVQEFPRNVADWLQRLHEYCFWEDLEPQHFAGPDGHPDVALFRGEGDRAQKELIIGFSGAAGNLGQPTPVFLQRLASDSADLLLLRDADRERYGVSHASCDRFLELMATVGSMAEQYQSIVTVGNSMGGFPALLAGHLLGARRSTSLGGTMGRHESSDSRSAILDLLTREPAEVLCLFGAENSRDRVGALEQQAFFPQAQLIAVSGIASHNISHSAFQQGSLKSLFGLVLAPATDDPPADRIKDEGEVSTVTLKVTCEPPAWAHEATPGKVWSAQAVAIPGWARRITRRVRVPHWLARTVRRFAYERFGLVIRLRSKKSPVAPPRSTK